MAIEIPALLYSTDRPAIHPLEGSPSRWIIMYGTQSVHVESIERSGQIDRPSYSSIPSQQASLPYIGNQCLVSDIDMSMRTNRGAAFRNVEFGRVACVLKVSAGLAARLAVNSTNGSGDITIPYKVSR